MILVGVYWKFAWLFGLLAIFGAGVGLAEDDGR